MEPVFQKAMLNKIFTPNFTTKTSGTGLGLAMCKGIVEKSNGRIWFETVEGEKTIFFVELPVVPRAEALGDSWVGRTCSPGLKSWVGATQGFSLGISGSPNKNDGERSESLSNSFFLFYISQKHFKFFQRKTA